MSAHTNHSAAWVWLLLAVALAACGCTAPRKTMSLEEQAKLVGDEWVYIAGIDGGDRELQETLRDTLKANGILCIMYGSMGYAVVVPRALFYDAKRVLDQRPELKGRLFGVVDHPK